MNASDYRKESKELRRNQRSKMKEEMVLHVGYLRRNIN